MALSKAHLEVKAISANREGVIRKLQASLLGINEGGVAQQEWGMDSAIAALLSSVVARMEQLMLEVGEIDEGLIWQWAAAPHAILALHCIRGFRLKRAK